MTNDGYKLRVNRKWRQSERERLEVIIQRIKATVEAIDIDRELVDWPNMRETAASLVQSASQLQAQCAVLTIIEPTDTAKRSRGN